MLPALVLERVTQVDPPELSRRFNVMSVTKTVINGVEELVGAQPEPRVMAAVRAALGMPDEQQA